MTKTTVRWVNALHFVGTDSTNHSVVLSGQQQGIGVKPSEMLLIALASCSAVDVVEILKKKRKQLTMLEVTTEAKRDPNPPWAYRQIHLKYCLSGRGLTEKSIEQAIRLSLEKYCSVAATIGGVAQITSGYELVPNGLD
jgi:putative redox protein